MINQLCTVAKGTELGQVNQLASHLSQKGIPFQLHVLLIDFPDCVSLYPPIPNTVFYPMDTVIPKFWLGMCFAFSLSELKIKSVPFFIDYLKNSLSGPVSYLALGVQPESQFFEQIRNLKSQENIVAERLFAVIQDARYLAPLIKQANQHFLQFELKFLIHFDLDSLSKQSQPSQSEIKYIVGDEVSNWITVSKNSLPEPAGTNLSQFPDCFSNGRPITDSDRLNFLALHRFEREAVGNPFQNEEYFRQLIVIPTHLRFKNGIQLLWTINVKMKKIPVLNRLVPRTARFIKKYVYQ